MIQYWTTLSWLNPFVGRDTTQWPERLCQKCFSSILSSGQDTMQDVCADVTPPLPPAGQFITRGTTCLITACPNISVDRETLGVVYYWTGWCIDRPGSRPDFGGLAALLSSLSFPQHQSRWLQLPTDHCVMDWCRAEKQGAGRCPQNKTCGEVGDFCYRAEQIDRWDAVMSDLPRGWRENLYPVRAHWRSEPRDKWKCCCFFFFSAWFLYFQYLVIIGRTDPFGGFVVRFVRVILYSANRPRLEKKSAINTIEREQSQYIQSWNTLGELHLSFKVFRQMEKDMRAWN